MSKTMFDEALGQGTLEIQDRHGKLLGRKAVDLDAFSIQDFTKHLREGLTLNLYRLPLEFDALTIKDVSNKVRAENTTVGAAVPPKDGLGPKDPFEELDAPIPPINIGKPRKPEIVEAWGYTLDMSYSRHYKADIRLILSRYLGKDRSDVNDAHRMSNLGLTGPKIIPLLAHFNVSHLPIKPNFAKMTFRQFVGLLHYENMKG